VADREQVFAAVDHVVTAIGGLDCVVANAGVGMYGPFLELAPEHLEQMIDVNLKGTLYTAAATLPHLIAAGGGDFVSLTSVAGLRGLPGETVYNASKFGQLGFTRSLDHEMREHGVRVTNVCPGGIATDFAMGAGRTPDMPELEGMMSAEEVAEVVWFIASRPKGLRMMTVSFRPMSEGSWG
jgi:NADP-dependent 3-hydroxy acid dehydrogenase YdfG